MARKILIVDDDRTFLDGTRLQLKSQYQVLTATSTEEAMRILSADDVDLVLLDVGLGGENGLEGIKKIHGVHPSVGISMLSGQRDVNIVVEAIRAGAVDYLTKPLDRDALAAVMERAAVIRNAKECCEALTQPREDQENAANGMIFQSEAMRTLLDEAERLRGHDANVVIIGETGTGKELLARHIYRISGGLRRPFVAVNCAAIPENLLESELFGHEAGAFTGAARRRVGKFELADGGDIFLDEISTMRMDLQAKLLRVLQEKEFCRVGGNDLIRADFRVISASNQPLEKLVENGTFRMDLYHRLKVVQFGLPPLRDRTGDVELLVRHYADKFASGGQGKRFSDEAMAKLKGYRWPGNIRELANVVQSLVILAKGDVVDDREFPAWVLNGAKMETQTIGLPIPGIADSVSSLKEYVQTSERRYIEHVLKHSSGDKSRAAQLLGIGRTTLYEKISELGIVA